jgi:hypothetical protein
MNWKTIAVIGGVGLGAYFLWKKFGSSAAAATPVTTGTGIRYVTSSGGVTTAFAPTTETMTQRMNRIASSIIGATNLSNYRINFVRGEIRDLSNNLVWTWNGTTWLRYSSAGATPTVMISGMRGIR